MKIRPYRYLICATVLLIAGCVIIAISDNNRPPAVVIELIEITPQYGAPLRTLGLPSGFRVLGVTETHILIERPVGSEDAKQ